MWTFVLMAFPGFFQKAGSCSMSWECAHGYYELLSKSCSDF